MATRKTGKIYVGVGGWNFAPWRGSFYPKGVTQAKELHYASRQLTSIEINSTFYGLQKPATFKKWHDETPDDFVFSLKAPRFVTNRGQLASAASSIERFLASGILQLGDKLGPINWQLAPGKPFDAADLEAFLALLPQKLDGRPLRHALEVRDASFADPAYVALARNHNVATDFTDSPEYPSFADVTGDFVYARLRCSEAKQTTGYAPATLDAWARRAREWARGSEPDDLPRVAPPSNARERDVFVYFINGAKERAPAAAMALLDRLHA